MANNCGLNIATAIQEKIYIVKEDVCGALKIPKNDGTECILIIDAIDFNAKSEILEDRQLRPIRSRRMPMLGRVRTPEYTIKTYVKPSGIRGVPPQERWLLEGGLGQETIYENDRVNYTLTNLPHSYSIWINLGHSVYAISGATVNEIRYTGAGDKEAEYTFSGQGMKLHRATINKSNLVSKDNNVVNIFNPEYFTPEMPIYFIDNKTQTVDGKNNPYVIVDVIIDTSGNNNHQLVLDRKIEIINTDDATVMPYIPENCVDYGYPQFGKYGITTLNSQPFIITSWTITLNNNIKYYENEKNGVPFATAFGVVKPRQVNVEVEAYFRPELASFYYKHFTLSRDELVIPAGDIDGRICEWKMPSVIWEAPNYRGNEEVSIQLRGQAVGINGNDELVVVYR